MKKVLGAPPRLEILEDRLPPGEWFLAATLGWSLLGRDFAPKMEATPPEAFRATWSFLHAPDCQRSSRTSPPLGTGLGRARNIDLQSTAGTARMLTDVRDLFEHEACVLPGISGPATPDALSGQEQEESGSRGGSASNLSLGSLSTGVGKLFAANVHAVGSVAFEGPGQDHENYSGMILPSSENSAGLNSVALASLTALRMGGTSGPGSKSVATFAFVDRPDARVDENYGLVPDTFGFASGLLVTFDVSRGQLARPQVVAAPSLCGDAATEVIGENSVLVDFRQACVLPASPGVPTGMENQVTLQIDADPSADVTPSQITWLAPIHNVVPRRLSSETNFDSEPTLAVNPAGGTIALTTFSGDWSEDQSAPLWVSGTEGRTWDQRLGIPQPEPGAFGPFDQTIAYNQDGSVLYGAFLGGNRFFRAYVRATPDPLTSDFGGTFASGGGVDQPWIQVGSVDPDTGLDRVYMSVNDQSYELASASVLVSNDGGATFQDPPVRLERGTAVFGDHPPRVAVSGNRVYGAFLRRTGSPTGAEGPGEVVVVRDDQGGFRGPANPDPFGVLGQGVVLQSGSYPTAEFLLGQQRIGGDLSLAIDPRDPDTVYLSFSRIENHQPVLYVHRSQDGGNTWQDLLAIDDAAIGNLAVADNGTWGLLNVRVNDGRMFQEFRQNGGKPTVLTSWPVNDPRGGRVYVGDYQSLVAVGHTFYAGFCASNFPDLANFPSGVVYQRNADFPGHHLLTMEGKPVAHTIDPFFFRQDASDRGANARALFTSNRRPTNKR